MSDIPQEEREAIDAGICPICGWVNCHCPADGADAESADVLEVCPDCGFFECHCLDGQLAEDGTEDDRYIDKRLSDREDFHSDDARFPSWDDEPYFPEY